MSNNPPEVHAASSGIHKARTRETCICLKLAKMVASTHLICHASLWCWNMSIAHIARKAFTWLSAESAMSPPTQLDNDVLDRTIRNIEQAQGHSRHRTTAADILQAQASNGSDLVSLPSSDMPGAAPPVDVDDTGASMPPPQIEVNTPINLTSDLAASTTLLQNLRVRNSILVADLARATLSLQQHEGSTIKLLSRVRRSRAKWMAVAIFSIAIWVLYLWWCWHMRVEFEYIRKRRRDVFGL